MYSDKKQKICHFKFLKHLCMYKNVPVLNIGVIVNKMDNNDAILVTKFYQYTIIHIYYTYMYIRVYITYVINY